MGNDLLLKVNEFEYIFTEKINYCRKILEEVKNYGQGRMMRSLFLYNVQDENAMAYEFCVAVQPLFLIN